MFGGEEKLLLLLGDHNARANGFDPLSIARTGEISRNDFDEPVDSLNRSFGGGLGARNLRLLGRTRRQANYKCESLKAGPDFHWEF